MTPLALFCRAPEPGRTKTRLIPALGAEAACTLYRAFVDDVLTTCTGAIGVETALWHAGPPDDRPLAEVAERHGVARALQPEGDLGERMARALGEAIARRGRGLVVGSDAPTLPRSLIRQAARTLGEADLVIGPAADGGYYLVGARREVPPIFAGMTWSRSTVLAETLTRARRAGLEVRLLPPWYDVDTPADLRLLRVHLALRPQAAPATARRLAAGGGAPGTRSNSTSSRGIR